MSDLICSVESCERHCYGHGLCSLHWKRMWKTGTTDPRVKPSVPERFASYVDKSLTDTGCWLWTGTMTTNGYGTFFVGGGRNVPAHRYALGVALGRQLDPEQEACHICDNPPCVRTDDVGTYEIRGQSFERRGHLFVGTTKLNSWDRADKGRGSHGDEHRARHIDILPRGERHYKAKITEADVLRIRARYAAGGVVQQTLGIEYGLDRTTISQIVGRRSWTHI